MNTANRLRSLYEDVGEERIVQLDMYVSETGEGSTEEG